MTKEFQLALDLVEGTRGGRGLGEGRAAWTRAMTCGNKHVMNLDQRWSSLGHSGTLKMEEIKEL